MREDNQDPVWEAPAGTPISKPSKLPAPHTWIYLTIIAILLASNIYLFIRGKGKTEMIVQTLVERDSVNTENASLQQEANAALARLDALQTQNASLSNEISSKDGELQQMKQELNTLLAKQNKTRADYEKATKLIASLNTKVRSYEERIASLEGENRNLSQANQSLSEEKEAAVATSEDLRRTGSILHASNIRMVPIDLRRGGSKLKETDKAKKVDMIRIYFDIDENRIAESGSRDVFLRINGPAGNLLSNAAYGSGVTTSSSGESIGYTLAKTVSLQKNQPINDVTVDWQQERNFDKGDYNVVLYSDGYKIGQGSFSLR